MIIQFKTKWGDRFVEGQVLAYMLRERLSDGYWYDDDETQTAEDALDNDQARSFMYSRMDHEYEGFDVIRPENIK